MNSKIGIAKEKILKGETIALVNMDTFEVTSDKIKFVPYGKKKIRNLCLEMLNIKVREAFV